MSESQRQLSSSFTATNTSNGFDILQSFEENPQLIRRRRRKSAKNDSAVMTTGAASDEEPSLSTGGVLDSLNIDRETSLPRAASFEGLDSLETTPIAPSTLPIKTASSSSLRTASNVLERIGSPTLRMLSHTDFSAPSHHHAPLQVMTDRPTVKRTMSEQIMHTTTKSAPSSAPVTARGIVPDGTNAAPAPQQHVMTPIHEGSLSPEPAVLLRGLSPSSSAVVLGTEPTIVSAAVAPTPTAAATVRRDQAMSHHHHHHRSIPSLPTASTLNAHNIPSEQGFIDFITAELQPGPSYPVADVVWGQTERDRVYNALLSVPFQLERLVWFGMSLCLDSFLAIFTLLPLRVLGAFVICVRNMTINLMSSNSLHTKNKNKSNNNQSNKSKNSKVGMTMELPRRSVHLQGDQLFDVLCMCMFAIIVFFLWHIKAGAIYFWVKELTQEFLKLSVLHTALELGDKICCSFGVDVLEALSASCTAYASSPTLSLHHINNVASDAILALTLLLAHSTVLIMQALVFGVAMNSQKNTLLALLIASNFTEIKGTVLKRFDPTKLFVLASQDIVERFHLLIVLAFVMVEEMVGTGASAPSSRLVSQCAYVLTAEVVIDVTKHAVLGKFNEIRPGVYREFTKDLCEHVASAQSHSMHRFVGFEPFAPAALFLRVVLSYASVHAEARSATSFVAVDGDNGGGSGSSLWSYVSAVQSGALAMLGWIVLTAFTTALGFVIKRSAVQYLKYYDAKRGRGRGTAHVRNRAVTVGLMSPVTSGGGHYNVTTPIE